MVRSRFALVALASALAMAGCGGSAATPQAASPASAAPSTEATPAPTPSPTPAPAATPSPTETPTASTTAGRTGRIELPAQHIALTLPDGWVEVVLSGEDIDTILKAFPAGTWTDEQVAMMKQAAAAGIALMAFDSDGKGSNINLLVQEAQVSMDLLAPLLPSQLKAIPGASNIEVTKTKALGEDALVATYTLKNTLADGSVSEMTGTQLYVAANGRLYVSTVTLAKGATLDPMDVFATFESLP